MTTELKSLWDFLRPHHRRAYVILALGAACTGVEIWTQTLVRPLIDDGIVGRDYRAFLSILALQVAASVAATGINWIHVRAYVGLSADVSEWLRLRLFEKTQRLPLAYFSTENAAKLQTNITTETGAVSAVIGQILGSVVVSGMQAVGAAGVLLWIDWRLALPSLLLLPAHAWLAARAGASNETLEKEYYGVYDEVTRFLQERLSFPAKIVFSDPSARRQAESRFAAHARHMRDVGWRLTILGHSFAVSLSSLLEFEGVFLYGLGGWLILKGSLTLGGLLAFAAVKSSLDRPVGELAGAHVTIKTALVHWERLRELLDWPQERDGSAPYREGKLALDGVMVRRGDSVVLDGTSFTLPERRFIALTGPTGAGKTTLALLLQRHLAPDAGRVTADGADLSAVSLDSLRERTAFLGQEPVLIAGTIRENLRLYKSDASDAELREACRLAAVDGLVSRLPLGLDTPVGTAGSTLSGGEKQRLCLARVLLKKPSFLILDEPTASVDEDTEREICRVLRMLVDVRGVGVLAVTHRPELAKAADLVVSLRDGKLFAS